MHKKPEQFTPPMIPNSVTSEQIQAVYEKVGPNIEADRGKTAQGRLVADIDIARDSVGLVESKKHIKPAIDFLTSAEQYAHLTEGELSDNRSRTLRAAGRLAAKQAKMFALTEQAAERRNMSSEKVDKMRQKVMRLGETSLESIEMAFVLAASNDKKDRKIAKRIMGGPREALSKYNRQLMKTERGKKPKRK